MLIMMLIYVYEIHNSMINIPQQCVRYQKHFGLILCAIVNSDYLDKYAPDVLHIVYSRLIHQY